MQLRKEIYTVEKIEEKISDIEIYKIFQGEPFSVILDSSLKNHKLGRYSIITFKPFMLFKSKGNNVELIKEEAIEKIYDDPLKCLKELLNKYKFDEYIPGIPFFSGCVGYFSYDLFRIIEKLHQNKKEDEDVPDIMLGFYNSAVIIDHENENVYVVATSIGLPDSGDLEQTVKQKLAEIKTLITKNREKIYKDEFIKKDIKRNTCDIISDFTKESYCETIKRAKEYIRNGDVYQVNLSQRFRTKINKKPFEVFEKLREISPVSFSAYINFEDIKIISSSPERFIKIDNRIIETRPIKGTRPRGKNPDEDKKLKEELLNSEKDRAELIMIVDLERNDLGRVCKIGTVKVENLIELEEYSTVFHQVSTIKGELKEDADVVDCIKAAFPGGSITGAPKIRAMEIIDELEPVNRNIYTGSIGYIGFNGETDLNIAIRSIIVKKDEAVFNVGGGIVWDSVPQKEYQETLDKAKALIQALSD